MAEQQVTYSGAESIQLRYKEMDLESGVLGRVFGNSRNAPANIGGFVVVALILACVGLAIAQGVAAAGEFLKWSGPIITLVLGYVFGRRSEE